LLKIIDDTPQTFVEIRFDFEPEFFAHNGNDSIFVIHHRNTWKNASKSKNAFSTFSIYDFNLNLKNEISPEFNVMSCFATAEHIFLQMEKTFVIQVYNWNLERVSTIGQTVYADKSYYFRDFTLKMVKLDRIYLGRAVSSTAVDEAAAVVEHAIRVVSLSSGQVVNEYCLTSGYEDIFIDALSRTIAVDTVNGFLRIYDKPQSGQADPFAELIYEGTLEMEKTSGHHMTADGRFFFVKDKSKIQCFSFCKVS
jgi:hypothetical protein